jgi:N-acetylneuraminic acid mutarotase
VVEDSEEFRFQVVIEEDDRGARVAIYSFPKPGWDDWWARTGAGFSLENVKAVASEVVPLPAPQGHLPRFTPESAVAESATAVCNGDDTWDIGGIGSTPIPRLIHTAVWTGTEMIVWGGLDGITWLDDGGRYDPLTDTWQPLSTVAAPLARGEHSAVWTGDRMIVWGGSFNFGAPLNTGGSYDPLTDTWTSLSVLDVPQAREAHSAVWTGTEMIVWGGDDLTGDLVGGGGAYNPSTDTWRTIQALGEPDLRAYHTALWTGSEMIIWGGWASSGAKYDPVSDIWTTLSAVGRPNGIGDSAVWTGFGMIVWSVGEGARYSSISDTWTAISTVNEPGQRTDQSSVWAGTEMVVWGGASNPGFDRVETGGRYDPATDTWATTTLVGVPLGREYATTVWTGSEMIIWGGRDDLEWTTSSGSRYDPSTDTWVRTNAQIPVARTYHAGVWTGNELVFWSGANSRILREPTSLLSDGARYDPLVEAWTPISTLGAPAGRVFHTAVWTGTEMIVWGGEDLDDVVTDTGGRYDPVSDTWSLTTLVGAPPASSEHHAFWTGSEMIVWGGGDGTNPVVTGGQYDPSSDTWTATSSVGAPSGRIRDRAVWTGTELIVWGGQTAGVALDTGARYAPATDTWTPTSNMGAPAPRFWHASAWTGAEMIIWGGRDGTTSFSSGGRYDPTTDTWTPISNVGAPAGSSSAVWTGSLMVTSPTLPTTGRYDPAQDAWTPVTSVNAPHWRTNDVAVWTGSFIATWGGERRSVLENGARYFVGGPADVDQDGFACDTDCNDLDGDQFPGNPEVCDGLDNDCDGVVPASELDGDLDGALSCADCDDGDPARYPGNVEICDGLDNDCDGPADEDEDLDGFDVCTDCDNSDGLTFPGAAEVNDAVDNQCAGDSGFGLVDEITGLLFFPDASNPAEVCWPVQGGATRYALLRSDDAGFTTACSATNTPLTCLTDSGVPGLGQVSYYLARSVGLYGGSAGATSSGTERTGVCVGEFSCSDGLDNDGDGLTDCEDFADCLGQGFCGAVFQFEDTSGDDIPTEALARAFASVAVSASDYIWFSISGDTVVDFEWCAERADFYRDNYLALAPSTGTVFSGSWNRWYREEGGSWIGPVTDSFRNSFGLDCGEPYGWCAEMSIGGTHLPGLFPSEIGLCEVFDNLACGGTLSIGFGTSRLSACGF